MIYTRNFKQRRSTTNAALKTMCIKLIQHGYIKTFLTRIKEIRKIVDRVAKLCRKKTVLANRAISAMLSINRAKTQMIVEKLGNSQKVSGFVKFKKVTVDECGATRVLAELAI